MQSTKEYLAFVWIIHISMFLGQLLFLLLSVYFIEPDRYRDYDLVFRISDGIVILVGVVFSYVIYSKFVAEAKPKRGIREKLMTYRKALIYKWAALEFVSVYSIIAYLMTGSALFIFATIFTILIFLINRPSVNIAINDLDLDDSERRILETPDAAI
ncbi:MAG: hypothetical protein RL662_1720 [Bacteroidota bacterium]|jgi:MFS family permease